MPVITLIIAGLVQGASVYARSKRTDSAPSAAMRGAIVARLLSRRRRVAQRVDRHQDDDGRARAQPAISVIVAATSVAHNVAASSKRILLRSK